MALKTDEVIVIGAGLLLFWLILASTLSKFRSPSVSLLILLILGSLGAVFYGIHEDKSNLWWIIPTVVIGLCLVGVVYLVSRRRKGTKFEDPIQSLPRLDVAPIDESTESYPRDTQNAESAARAIVRSKLVKVKDVEKSLNTLFARFYGTPSSRHPILGREETVNYNRKHKKSSFETILTEGYGMNVVDEHDYEDAKKKTNVFTLEHEGSYYVGELKGRG
jgi:hypothetical protein